jgi:hypothetical protein
VWINAGVAIGAANSIETRSYVLLGDFGARWGSRERFLRSVAKVEQGREKRK